MIIKQISVFLENRPGTLAEVLGVLATNNINLRAMSVADTSDFGILRLVVTEPDKVERVLKDANLAIKITPVLAIKVSDTPGGLLENVNKLRDAKINIEYVYAFAASTDEYARVVIKVDDLHKAELVMGEDNADFVW